jgi:hypothetical protein
MLFPFFLPLPVITRDGAAQRSTALEGWSSRVPPGRPRSSPGRAGAFAPGRAGEAPTGGVTTLERTLSDLCALCRDTLEAGDEVRTLSCNHVFHCSGNSEKCEIHIDKWLRVAPRIDVLPDLRQDPSSGAAMEGAGAIVARASARALAFAVAIRVGVGASGAAVIIGDSGLGDDTLPPQSLSASKEPPLLKLS